MTDKKYRDELVDIIKDVGKELINRAEEMVSEDCKMITNFSITIDIPQSMEGPPAITWSTSTLVNEFINRKFGAACKSHIDMNTETVLLEENKDAQT